MEGRESQDFPLLNNPRNKLQPTEREREREKHTQRGGALATMKDASRKHTIRRDTRYENVAKRNGNTRVIKRQHEEFEIGE